MAATVRPILVHQSEHDLDRRGPVANFFITPTRGIGVVRPLISVAYRDPEQQKRATSEWQQRQQKESRIELVALLGGRCVRCGYASDVRALCVDHVRGGGTAEGKRYGWTRYRVIIKKVLAGSSEYQVLCANCNQIKKIEAKEQPRRGSVPPGGDGSPKPMESNS